ncbi:Mitogen-activated protein kinase-binding protein 1 [Glycine soja]|uniref:Mitogen-activated protein kinase-binding protein 1 n=1 Tax=Glycine soja TaxID=3848 RepID=A0A0B2PL13_GLYSO|nr:Mitogen-activated protein kinase-binding protein 1 [Glycine soja]
MMVINFCSNIVKGFYTVYDMAVDQTCDTVGQDKKIKTFDMAAQKLIRSYNHDKIFGEPIKVMMDPSCCTYVVCSFSNKSICIYDFITGEMVVKATGHAEIVTGVILPDCKHIVLILQALEELAGRHKAVISEDKNSFGLNNLSKNEKSGVAPDQYVGCNNNDASWCSEEVSESKAEQLYLSESGSVSEITTDGNLSSLPSEEDMFKQHFGSLSNTHKIVISVQVKSSNSLVRRFSAGYIVQWDCKKLFSSPVRNKGATHTVSEE